jgi:hypothetical protein
LAAKQDREALRQGHARNRLRELPPPGRAPFGYRRNRNRYIIDRHTAPIVKDFFDRFLLYGSLRGAVRYLAAKHHKKISVSTAQRWLSNPVYRGDTGYHNGDRILDTHPAILTRAEAAQIDRLLHQNRQLPARTASAQRSLAGLVKCGHCQIEYSITSTAGKYIYFRPTKCPLESKCGCIPYDLVLQMTIDRICRDLPIAISRMDGLDPATTRSGLIDRIQFIQQQIDTSDLEIEDRYRLKTDISQLQQQLATLSPINLVALSQAVSIPQFWLDLSESERRFYFREFIRSITSLCHNGELDLKLQFNFEPRSS